MGIFDKILLLRLIGTFAGLVLAAFNGFLVENGIVSQATVDDSLSPNQKILVGLIGFGLTCGWRFIARLLSHNTVAVTKLDALGDMKTTAVKVTSEQVVRDIH